MGLFGEKGLNELGFRMYQKGKKHIVKTVKNTSVR